MGRQMAKNSGCWMHPLFFVVLSPQSAAPGSAFAPGFGSCSAAGGVPPGHKTAAESPVEVEAAAGPGTVQGLTHKVQPRTAPERKALRLQFGQSQPAAGGLRLFPAAGGHRLKPPVLGGMGQGLPGRVGRGGQFVRQTGLLPKAAGPAWGAEAPARNPPVYPPAGRAHGLPSAGPAPGRLWRGTGPAPLRDASAPAGEPAVRTAA